MIPPRRAFDNLVASEVASECAIEVDAEPSPVRQVK
jgi:hypothetical protein